MYKGLSDFSDEEIFKLLKKAIYSQNHKFVAGTSHSFSYMLLKPNDYPCSDGIYDLLANKWVKGPIKIPEDFDPDKAFIKQRKIAEEVAGNIDLIIGKIMRTIDDLNVLDKFEKQHGSTSKRTPLIQKLEILCRYLNDWYNWIWALQEQAKELLNPSFPAFNYSPNWDEKMIVFKYLARSGYQQCISNLYKLLKDSPYLKMIDSFIPD